MRWQDESKKQKKHRLVSVDSETISMLKEWRKHQNYGAISLHDSLVFSYHQKMRTYELERQHLVRHFKKAKVPKYRAIWFPSHSRKPTNEQLVN